MISLQTNVDSLNAQRNLSLDNQFQSKTIQQLTSGYRINSSGDDAAGLAIANGYASQITELNQGVNNANSGVSQLQIVDGGLSNISTILQRLQTLATQSASATFTGNRGTLNQEYQGLIGEIDRQASNINLNAGGTFNNALNVFIGGGSNATNSSIAIDLSGSQNAVDATSLGLAATNILGGGVGFSGNTTRLDAPGAAFLSGSASESFQFNLYSNGGAQTVTATVNGGASGVSESGVLSQLNSSLNQYGINASVNGNGLLTFSGATAFNVTDTAGTPALISAGTVTASNSSNYILGGAASYTAPTAGTPENLTIQTAGHTVNVSLTSINAGSVGSALSVINSQTAQYGVYAVLNTAGTGIEFQGANSFSVNSNLSAAGVFTAGGFHSSTAPVTGTTNNATSAITAIGNAIQSLGLVQGVVGAGENKLQYAIGLAQSQISSFSAAESQIKDADVAAQAANLTKAQVLTQTSVAALAQANSEPQSILKLLQ
jgi:flagellin